jgi:hypothetical protein
MCTASVTGASPDKGASSGPLTATNCRSAQLLAGPASCKLLKVATPACTPAWATPRSSTCAGVLLVAVALPVLPLRT